MRAGRLREKISIWREVVTTDTDYGSADSDYELFLNTRAEVMYLGGSELIQNSTVSNTINAVFTLRFREGIDETMQVEYRGNMYNIKYIEENRQKEYLKLTTTKILN
jgi:SPP1 family predicted phage head-tail adaptor